MYNINYLQILLFACMYMYQIYIIIYIVCVWIYVYIINIHSTHIYIYIYKQKRLFWNAINLLTALLNASVYMLWIGFTYKN